MIHIESPHGLNYAEFSRILWPLYIYAYTDVPILCSYKYFAHYIFAVFLAYCYALYKNRIWTVSLGHVSCYMYAVSNGVSNLQLASVVICACMYVVKLASAILVEVSRP